jgi:hypothetical protein
LMNDLYRSKSRRGHWMLDMYIKIKWIISFHFILLRNTFPKILFLEIKI